MSRAAPFFPFPLYLLPALFPAPHVLQICLQARRARVLRVCGQVLATLGGQAVQVFHSILHSYNVLHAAFAGNAELQEISV